MTIDDAERAENMRLLAQISGPSLAAIWSAADVAADATDLRRPETGLVTVRGRVGGDGQPFNLGEATVTRAAVRLSTGEVGHSYILGRDTGKARLCATIDAAWQREATRDAVRTAVGEVRRQLEEADSRVRSQVAATRVDFFTMVRGDD